MRKIFTLWLIFAICSLAYIMYLSAGLAVNIKIIQQPPNQIQEQLVDIQSKQDKILEIFSQVETYEITAYVATGNKTATGTIPKAGRTIAVDPKVIPYGTKVWIEGIGFRVAEDCGGAVNGKIIDLFVEENALKFGEQKRKVVVP